MSTTVFERKEGQSENGSARGAVPMGLAVILFAASSGVLGTLLLVLAAPFVVVGGAMARLRDRRRAGGTRARRFEAGSDRRKPLIIEGEYVVLDERPPSKAADASAAPRAT